MGLPQSCPLPGPVLHQHSLDVKINTSCLVELPRGPPHPGWGESLLPISILTLQAEWSVTLGGPGAPCLWGQLALIKCPWWGESVPAVENCSESNRKKWWTELPCLCSWLRSPLLCLLPRALSGGSRPLLTLHWLMSLFPLCPQSLLLITALTPQWILLSYKTSP